MTIRDIIKDIVEPIDYFFFKLFNPISKETIYGKCDICGIEGKLYYCKEHNHWICEGK